MRTPTRLLFLIVLAAAFTGTAHAQQLRYFRFRTECGHGAWQDTAFVAATTSQQLIDSLLDELTRPYEQRRFINGPIAAGNAGYNRNGPHWFLWHFEPDAWQLVEAAIEVCDGCP